MAAVPDTPVSPAVKASPLDLPAEATVGEAFRRCLDNCFTQLAGNEGLFVAERHPDNLHQTRVSWRRARATFSLFRPLWRGDETAEALKVRMREIVMPLGPARDADVLLRRAVEEGLPARVQRALRGRRRRTYAVAVPLLRSPQWVEMKADLHAWLDAADWLDDARELRDAPARTLTDGALQKRYRRLEAAGADLLTMPAHDLHLVRIEGKKFRYGCEFFTSLYADSPGSPPAEFAIAMGAMQDAFGAANDHATAAHILAAHGFSPALLGPMYGRAECVTAWSDVMALDPFWTTGATGTS
ncbi:MAG: CHAD domain-containing protein [Actinobacteria bacterium]|nr:CHAD domain-containing protein [Actinomycetota bacterium]